MANIIEEIFKKSEDGKISYDDFKKLSDGMKFADISKGDYVAKAKYDDETKAKDDQIAELQKTISTRDTDLTELKKKLEEAGGDAEKLTKLTADFTALQTKYDTEIKDYQEKIAKQSYEYAVNNVANEKKFTSEAAKRDFKHSLIDKQLKMEEGKLVGLEDFIKEYSTSNADAFVVEDPNPNPANPNPAAGAAGAGANGNQPPVFAGSTNSTGADGGQAGGEPKSQFGFNFHSVH